MCLLCGVSCLLPVLSAGSWERKAIEYYPFTAEYRFLLCLRHRGAVEGFTSEAGMPYCHQ